MTMQMEDICKIEIMGEMTMERYASFQMLYYPLIGMDAAILYHTLYAIGTRKQKISNHRLILEISNLSIEFFEKTRKQLEQYLLMKTYYQEERSVYVYQIYLPKCGNEFLRHEVFGRLYLKKMGTQVYEFTKLCFSYDRDDLSDYRNITTSFSSRFQSEWKDELEEQYMRLKPQECSREESDISISFQYDVFLQGFSKILFPESQRNEKNLKEIGTLATIYCIDEQEMRKYVAQSMNLKTNTLNLELLKKKVRNAKPAYQEIIEDKDPYDMPPIMFMQHLQRGIPVSESDKRLIERLLREFKLKPDVVNVLISYVLEKNNQRFTKAYVEKIAAAWVRLQIDTSQKALQLIKEEQITSYPKKKKELPAYLDQNEDVQEQVNDEELLKMMEQLRGE